jgi:hypothetical protein
MIPFFDTNPCAFMVRRMGVSVALGNVLNMCLVLPNGICCASMSLKELQPSNTPSAKPSETNSVTGHIDLSLGSSYKNIIGLYQVRFLNFRGRMLNLPMLLVGTLSFSIPQPHMKRKPIILFGSRTYKVNVFVK